MMKKYKKLDFNTEDLESLSNSDLKRVADYWLRQYLLEIGNRGDGMYRCPLKKQMYQSNKMHVAHFIDRGVMGLRYNLFNCHLISEQSNMWEAQEPFEGYKSKHHYEYEMWLLEEYEPAVLEFLREKGKEIKVFYKEDYIKVIEKFRGNE